MVNIEVFQVVKTKMSVHSRSWAETIGDWIPGWPRRQNRRNGEILVDGEDSEIQMRVPREDGQVSVASAPAGRVTNEDFQLRPRRSVQSVPAVQTCQYENDAESEYSSADEGDFYDFRQDRKSDDKPTRQANPREFVHSTPNVETHRSGRGDHGFIKDNVYRRYERQNDELSHPVDRLRNDRQIDQLMAPNEQKNGDMRFACANEPNMYRRNEHEFMRNMQNENIGAQNDFRPSARQMTQNQKTGYQYETSDNDDLSPEPRRRCERPGAVKSVNRPVQKYANEKQDSADYNVFDKVTSDRRETDKNRPSRRIRITSRDQPIPRHLFETPKRKQTECSETSASRRKPCNPERFDGNKIEWPDYRKHFETVASWNGWNESEKAMQLVMSLQGEALMVLSDVPYDIQNSYEALVAELTRRFNPVERESAHRVEFRNRHRNVGESAMTYGYALKRLAVKAFPTMTLSAQEQWVMDQFVTGLGNIDIRKHVQFGHPLNLNEAISLAVEYEAFDTSTRDKIRKPSHAEVCRVETSTENDNRYGKKFTGPRDLSHITCYRCNKKGHYRSHCPELIANQSSSEPAHTNAGQSRVNPNQGN